MTAWDAYSPADFGTETTLRRPVLTVAEASERQEAARLAMLQAEDVFKAARAAFRQACRDHEEARRGRDTSIAGEVALFGEAVTSGF